MPKLNGRFPKYRLHRNSGQAIVTLNQRDHYLGKFGSEESRAEYDRLIAQWLSQGRLTPASTSTVKNAATVREIKNSTTSVSEVILGFWKHAEIHYRKADGTWTSELDNFRQALRPLRRLYGSLPADHFGPKSLKGLREHMIGLDWCRSHINKQVSRIKSLFRWAVENEIVPATVHHGLLTVNRQGTNRRQIPMRQPADRYTVNSYRQAIWRACDKAFPAPIHLSRAKVQGTRALRWETAAEWKARLGPKSWNELRAWQIDHRWHPHQLRHNAATHIRKEFGIEVARVILGHRSASVTEIYAELDDEKAKVVMTRIG